MRTVLAQEDAAWELLLVDDGSTDGTADAIREFAAQDPGRIRGLFGPNRGPGAARERGVGESRGEYVLYLDSDDHLTEGTIALRAAALRDSGADVAYCDWRRIRDDGTEVVARRMEDVDEDPEIATFTNFWAPPGALLYRREIVDRVGGWSRTLRIGEDARYLFDAASAGAKFVHVPGVGLDYRVRSGSLSRESRDEFHRQVFLNASEVEDLWRAAGPLTDARRDALLGVFGYVARQTYESDRAQFDLACERLFALDPKYAPRSPRHLAVTSRIVGYRRAEWIASRYRQAKRWLPGRS